MFSGKFKARLMGLALVGTVLSASAAAEAGVVVRSTGPSAGDYPVGREIPDSATITLRSGDRITVLTEGGTRVMQGPGTFRVGEGATRTRGRFSRMTRRGAQRSVRTGAVRGDTGPATSPNLWLLNVSAPGTMCVYDFERVRLWRPEAGAAQTYSIVDQATQDSLDVAFVGNEAMRAVDPAGIALSDGGTYTITSPVSSETGEATSVVVTLVGLSEEFENPADLAAALYERGCTTQLALLADTAEAEAND